MTFVDTLKASNSDRANNIRLNCDGVLHWSVFSAVQADAAA